MTELTNLDERLNLINRQFRAYRNAFLAALVIGMAFNAILFWVAAGPERPGESLMELELMQPWSAPALCPGETVDFDYIVHIRAPGVFQLDRSLWRVTPPLTLIFSQTETGVYPAAIDFVSRREWVVPLTYTSPVDEQPATLAPGQYEFRWSMSTASRSTVPSILVIPFSVRPDCP